MHLHRGLGAVYAVLAAIVIVIVLLSTASYLMGGEFLFALFILVAGLGMSWFLATLSLAMTGPNLHVDASGVRGRMTWRQPVAATWSEVTVDIPDDQLPERFDLTVGPHSTTLYEKSWAGFRDFVLVLASTPAAVPAITPAARTELARLLHLEDRDEPDRTD